MKQLFTTLLLTLLVCIGYAQSPEKFSYQAIIRDASNNLVINSLVRIKTSILKNDISGTVVFAERQRSLTNDIALLNIQIGGGIPIIGSIDAIDWSVNTYYLKSEIDYDGDGNFDFEGVSQLLSVPYALHAKTADHLIESQTLEDVVAIGNNADDQLKNVTDPTDAQDAVTKIYLDQLIADLDAQIDALENPAAVIGQYRDGGVVFWVDPANPSHGLVCAITDQATAIHWGCNGTDITGAVSSNIGDGAANTTAIITDCATPGIAADVVSNLSLNSYSDWFLPSRYELNEMYANHAIINNAAVANGGTAFLTSYAYWSSTQSAINGAFMKFFSNGTEIGNAKMGFANVRAVRAF